MDCANIIFLVLTPLLQLGKMLEQTGEEGYMRALWSGFLWGFFGEGDFLWVFNHFKIKKYKQNLH